MTKRGLEEAAEGRKLLRQGMTERGLVEVAE